MELIASYDVEGSSSMQRIQHELWPLGPIDPKKAKFPCCLVWTPLPVVSWLAPFIGHVGISREDGAVLDFSGSNFVNVDDFAFGSVARYLLLDRSEVPYLKFVFSLSYIAPMFSRHIVILFDKLAVQSEMLQCCFPPHRSAHTCKHGYRHSEYGTAITWDDALQSSMRYFENKNYNLFTCNCHSFVANCLNRLCYCGSMSWNMINIGALILWKGRWVDFQSIVRSFLPFLVVVSIGVLMVGWPFLLGLLSFPLLLMGWFVLGTYLVKNLLEC